MAFYENLAAAADRTPFPIYDTCLCCGRRAEGPSIGWDLELPGQETPLTRALFHIDCAFKMSQGIICDAWPNRHPARAVDPSSFSI